MFQLHHYNNSLSTGASKTFSRNQFAKLQNVTSRKPRFCCSMRFSQIDIPQIGSKFFNALAHLRYNPEM